jgi:hypothetical protein
LQDRPRRLEDARAAMDAGLAGRGAGGHVLLLHAWSGHAGVVAPSLGER